MYSDIREYMDALKERGLLIEYKDQAHWNLEVGALCTMSNRVGGPAIHFQNVKGYPGVSLVGSLFSGPNNLVMKRYKTWSRMAVAMDLDLRISYEDFMEELITRSENTISPMEVTSGTCKEVIEKGEAVDIFSLPIPFLHKDDGGRYGTMSAIVVKDPETGWQNWGVYRWMASSPNELRVFFHKSDFFPEGKNISQIFSKYEREGKAMPACIVMGGDPTIIIASAMNADKGVNEVEIASGLSLNPIQLLKAENSDLMVPADAEVIIEGEFLPGVREEEGPFPEYTKLANRTKQPVFKIKTITHRKNPVIPIAAEGSSVSDSMVLLSMTHSAELLAKSRASFFHTRWMNLPVEAKMGLLIVSTKVPFSGYIGRFASHLFSLTNYKWFDRILFVDTDVEPIDLGRCFNDMLQKVHPLKDINAGPGGAPKNLVCAYPTQNGTTHRLAIDATWPAGTPKEALPVRTSFETSFTPEIQKKVIEMWNKELGFETLPVLERETADKLGIPQDMLY